MGASWYWSSHDGDLLGIRAGVGRLPVPSQAIVLGTRVWEFAMVWVRAGLGIRERWRRYIWEFAMVLALMRENDPCELAGRTLRVS